MRFEGFTHFTDVSLELELYIQNQLMVYYT